VIFYWLPAGVPFLIKGQDRRLLFFFHLLTAGFILNIISVMTAYNEIYRLADPAKEKPLISIGLPFQEACANHVRSEFNSFAVYIIVSASIARTSNNLTKLEDAIGKESICGVRKGIRQHTPLDDIVEIVNDARAKKADLIVTLGAGSITDGAKAISFV
jgi:glycerol dehydrogenase-like iron-containing ADH family enzyme